MLRFWLMALMVIVLGCSATDSDVLPRSPSPQPAVAATSIEDCPITANFPSLRPIPSNDWRASFPHGGTWIMSTPKQHWSVGTLDDQLWFDAKPGFWTAGGIGNEAVWLKPLGSDLEVAGSRLDGDGILTSDTSGEYPGDFQASGLSFSDAGCWAIKARAGDARLDFIIWVNAPGS